MAGGDVAVSLTNPISESCASFDGVDDKIRATPLSEISYTKSYTISFWVKTINRAAQYTFLNNTIDSSNSAIIGYRATGSNYLFFGHYNGTGYNAVSAGDINDNQWYHIVCTQTSAQTDKKMYVDGVDLTTGGASPNVRGTTVNVAFGSSTTNADPLGGFLRNVRFYNRVLSSSEITRLANDEDIRDGLVGHWKLNGDATDSVGGNDGTVIGAVFVTDSGAVDTAVTTQRTTINSISGNYYAVDVNNQTGVLTVAIDENV